MSRRLETTIAAAGAGLLLIAMFGLLLWFDSLRSSRMRATEEAVTRLEKQADKLELKLDLLTRSFSEHRKFHP